MRRLAPFAAEMPDCRCCARGVGSLRCLSAGLSEAEDSSFPGRPVKTTKVGHNLHARHLVGRSKAMAARTQKTLRIAKKVIERVGERFWMEADPLPKMV